MLHQISRQHPAKFTFIFQQVILSPLVKTLAQLIRIVELGHIDHALEAVGLGQLADEFVDFIADLLVPFKLQHVGKRAAFRHHDHGVWVPGITCPRHIS